MTLEEEEKLLNLKSKSLNDLRYLEMDNLDTRFRWDDVDDLDLNAKIYFDTYTIKDDNYVIPEDLFTKRLQYHLDYFKKETDLTISVKIDLEVGLRIPKIDFFMNLKNVMPNSNQNIIPRYSEVSHKLDDALIKTIDSKSKELIPKFSPNFKEPLLKNYQSVKTLYTLYKKGNFRGKEYVLPNLNPPLAEIGSMINWFELPDNYRNTGVIYPYLRYEVRVAYPRNWTQEEYKPLEFRLQEIFKRHNVEFYFKNMSDADYNFWLDNPKIS